MKKTLMTLLKDNQNGQVVVHQLDGRGEVNQVQKNSGVLLECPEKAERATTQLNASLNADQSSGGFSKKRLQGQPIFIPTSQGRAIIDEA
ncbi:hypothetical protein AB6D11_00400 [Vibrio splendidus]